MKRKSVLFASLFIASFSAYSLNFHETTSYEYSPERTYHYTVEKMNYKFGTTFSSAGKTVLESSEFMEGGKYNDHWIFGPYSKWGAGRGVAEFILSANPHKNNEAIAVVEIHDSTIGKIIATKVVRYKDVSQYGPDVQHRVRLDFRIPEANKEHLMETRIRGVSETNLKFYGINIEMYKEDTYRFKPNVATSPLLAAYSDTSRYSSSNKLNAFYPKDARSAVDGAFTEVFNTNYNYAIGGGKAFFDFRMAFGGQRYASLDSEEDVVKAIVKIFAFDHPSVIKEVSQVYKVKDFPEQLKYKDFLLEIDLSEYTSSDTFYYMASLESSLKKDIYLESLTSKSFSIVPESEASSALVDAANGASEFSEFLSNELLKSPTLLAVPDPSDVNYGDYAIKASLTIAKGLGSLLGAGSVFTMMEVGFQKLGILDSKNSELNQDQIWEMIKDRVILSIEKKLTAAEISDYKTKTKTAIVGLQNINRHLVELKELQKADSIESKTNAIYSELVMLDNDLQSYVSTLSEKTDSATEPEDNLYLLPYWSYMASLRLSVKKLLISFELTQENASRQSYLDRVRDHNELVMKYKNHAFTHISTALAYATGQYKGNFRLDKEKANIYIGSQPLPLILNKNIDASSLYFCDNYISKDYYHYLFTINGPKNFLSVVDPDPTSNDTVRKSIKEYKITNGGDGRSRGAAYSCQANMDRAVEDLYSLGAEYMWPILSQVYAAAQVWTEITPNIFNAKGFGAQDTRYPRVQIKVKSEVQGYCLTTNGYDKPVTLTDCTNSRFDRTQQFKILPSGMITDNSGDSCLAVSHWKYTPPVYTDDVLVSDVITPVVKMSNCDDSNNYYRWQYDGESFILLLDQFQPQPFRDKSSEVVAYALTANTNLDTIPVGSDLKLEKLDIDNFNKKPVRQKWSTDLIFTSPYQLQNLTWFNFNSEQHGNLESLGWDASNWAGETAPPLMLDLAWEELTEVQQQAFKGLGFFQRDWSAYASLKNSTPGPVFEEFTGAYAAFNGVDDFKATLLSAAFDAENKVTLSAKVIVNSFGNWDGVITKGINSSPYALQLWSDGSIRFTANYMSPPGSIGSGSWNSTLKLTAGVEHHILVTYDGSKIKFYVDGVLDSYQPKTQLWFGKNDELLVLGADWPGGDEYFDGQMKDVKVYTRALADWEIHLLAE